MTRTDDPNGPPTASAPVGERALVQAIGAMLAQLAPTAVTGSQALAFGDDMAPLPSGDSASILAWTTDVLMEGVDFRTLEAGWEAVGRKAMLVNLSDCAAMGGRPVGSLLALTLPRTAAGSDVLKLVRGAAEAGAAHGCPIVGGDTNSWEGGLVVAVTVAARQEAGGRWLARSAAKNGDRVLVSGPLGGSILGRHLEPRPRIELGVALSRLDGVHAAIDISDGLLIDLDRICESSGCGAILDERELQAVIHADAQRLSRSDGRPALDHALADGEDFELLVTADAAEVSRLVELGMQPIGVMQPERGLFLRGAGGGVRGLQAHGWEHPCG